MPLTDLAATLTGASAVDWAIAAATAVAYLGALCGAGAFFFLLLFREIGDAVARATMRRAALWTAAGVAAAWALAPLRAAFLGGGWDAASDPSLIGLVLETPLGPSAELRSAAGALILAAALLGPAAAASRWIGALGGIGLLAGVALAGHSAAAPGWELSAALLVHLVVVAAWIGALSPLEAACRDGAADGGRAAIPALMARFGRVGVVLVAAVIGAGVTLAIGLLPSFAAVWTPYGLLLLGKVALVALLLLIAARHKWALAPRLAADGPGALRRSIRRERWIAAAVVAATAVTTSFTGPG